MRGLVLSVLLVSAIGCKPKAIDTPEAAYRNYAAALKRGDAKTAWAALSTKTKSAAEARAKQVESASGGMVKAEADRMLFASGVKAVEPGEVKVLESGEANSTLEVKAGELVWREQMVREDGRWRVDLSGHFEEAKP
jgi:hypothetical protein